MTLQIVLFAAIKKLQEFLHREYKKDYTRFGI